MIATTGLAETIRDLEEIRLEVLRETVAALLRDMAADAADYTKAPEVPDQRYRRTGDLGLGWTDAAPLIDLSGDTLFGEVLNGVPYAAYVQGAGTQTATFQDRWRTEEQVMEAWEPVAADRIESAIDALVDS